MHSPAISAALSICDPRVAQRVWATIGPAAHSLPPGVRHASLALRQVDDVIDALDASLLPAEARSMTRLRLRAFIAGRLCAEHALSQMGVEPHGLARDALGAPRWPANVAGSIAHTDALAFAAVAGSQITAGLGIDSEPRVDDRGFHDIRRACCTPDECARLFGVGDDRLTATVVFSVKEAYYKAISARVGRIVEFHEVEVRQLDLRAGRADLAPVSATLTSRAADAEASVCIVGDLVHTAVVLPPIS